MNDSRDIVIVVDDDITNLTVARNSLAEKYNAATVPSGEKLFQILERITPALILLDIEMPVMGGYEVIKILKSREKTASIPVIFLTAKIDPESEIEGLNLGAVDYITKPFSRELLLKRIGLHIQFEKQKKELLKYSLTLESEVEKKTRTVYELQNAILKTVAELVECRDNVTGGHIERTQHYLRMLVNFLFEHGIYTEELSSWDIDLFVMSSQLHDVGKISIKDDLLMKPGKLTNEEFEEMKKHVQYGVEIIRKIEASATENEFLFFAEIIAGSHHEKWNGKGYPHGLKGEEIPLHGRLMAIVDVYDALTDERPYKKAFTHEKSVDIIREEKGGHFDPLVAEVFLLHEKEFESAKVSKMYTGADDAHRSSQNLSSTLMAVSNMVGTKDSTHTENMRRYLKILINALSNHAEYKNEMSEWDIEFFLVSAHLYDVGKIAVNKNILNKAGALTESEYEKIKGHTDFGVKVVQQIRSNVGDSSPLHHAEILASSHHEKWDGSGYPRGLKGKDIPLQGRIMAIVDVYDALTTDRPHRKKKTHKEAVEIMRNSSGTHFDPDLVAVFLECENEFGEVEKIGEMRGGGGDCEGTAI